MCSLITLPLPYTITNHFLAVLCSTLPNSARLALHYFGVPCAAVLPLTHKPRHNIWLSVINDSSGDLVFLSVFLPSSHLSRSSPSIFFSPFTCISFLHACPKEIRVLSDSSPSFRGCLEHISLSHRLNDVRLCVKRINILGGML